MVVGRSARRGRVCSTPPRRGVPRCPPALGHIRATPPPLRGPGPRNRGAPRIRLQPHQGCAGSARSRSARSPLCARARHARVRGTASCADLHPLLPGWNEFPDECCGQWTPDGRYFVFRSQRRWQTDLWIISEGRRLFGRSSPAQLTSGLLSFLMPAPSADGTKLFAVGVPVRGELVRLDLRVREFVRFLDGISATW
jgi:hypothetical protein